MSEEMKALCVHLLHFVSQLIFSLIHSLEHLQDPNVIRRREERVNKHLFLDQPFQVTDSLLSGHRELEDVDCRRRDW
jgi:hypothetical protein